MHLTAQTILPGDADGATLVGRAWIPGREAGPSPVAIRAGRVYDLAPAMPTSSQLLNTADPVRLVREALKSRWTRAIGDVDDLLDNSHAERRDPDDRLHAPRPEAVRGNRQVAE